MPAEHTIAVDLANVYVVDGQGREKFCTTLGWGDVVERVDVTAQRVSIRFTDFEEQPDGTIRAGLRDGVIRPRTSGPKAQQIGADKILVPKADDRVLRVDFVDVQQGDGAVIETADGLVVLVDGGDNPMFARYLASRFRGSSVSKPRAIDCVVVTHGDADHFSGLTEIFKSETNETEHKRLFIAPRRVFHNGLVKRPERSSTAQALTDRQLLGPTVVNNGKVFVTALVDDLLQVPDTEMNEPFRAWKQALQTYDQRTHIEFHRLKRGDDAFFDFLKTAGIDVTVLAPIPEPIAGQDTLPFLGVPARGRSGSAIGAASAAGTFVGTSASHTINGHSVVLLLRYGRIRFLFTGDLNEQSSRVLTRAHNDSTSSIDLQAEIFKAPHHGSADFSPELLQAVAPVVSVISSGDQNARKEYIHPRANLVAALGRYSRTEEPLVFVTEMVAFFKEEGWVQPETKKREINLSARRLEQLSPRKTPFYAFSRTAYGSVKIRTNGQRLLVFTASGQADMQEAYAFTHDEHGKIAPTDVRKV